jgi:hypothetical protein
LQIPLSVLFLTLSFSCLYLAPTFSESLVPKKFCLSAFSHLTIMAILPIALASIRCGRAAAMVIVGRPV